MSTLRFALAGIALLTFAAWYWLHPPYSPAQDLPPVSFVAFQVPASPEGGRALADAAREWPGITAAAYNPASGLLALGHTAVTNEPELQHRIEMLVPVRVSKAVFPEPSGPQCPVPAAFLLQLPAILLRTALISALLFFGLWCRDRWIHRAALRV